MRLPKMVSRVNKTKRYTLEFGGINRGSDFREGELADCRNLSSDLLPFISQRGQRSQITGFEEPTSLHAHNGVAVVYGTTFAYRKEGETEFKKKTELASGEKQIAQVGNQIVIYPEMVVYDIEKDEADVFTGTFLLPEHDRSYPKTHQATVEGKSIHMPNNGLWLDRKESIKTKLQAGQVISELFVTGWYNGSSERLYTKKQNVVISSVEETGGRIYITFKTELLPAGTTMQVDSGYLKIDAPALDFMVATGGRIWGCSGNTIYASAYNQPTEFNKFEGLSSDSYAIEVSTPGKFTGCAAYSSHVVFFKENYIHRIYGSRPSNFNMVTAQAPGVQEGCHRTVRELRERLFYKGNDGIYCYAGGMPMLISQPLGQEKYTKAVGGARGDKYYISMQDKDGLWELYVYDMQKNVFLKEDNTHFVDTAQNGGDLLYLDGDGTLWQISDNDDTKDIEWSAELREFNEVVNEKKGYSRLTIRLELDEGAYANIETARDNGRFEMERRITRPGRNVILVSIPPNRCDSFRVRLSGKGGCRVQNLTREFITGGGIR